MSFLGFYFNDFFFSPDSWTYYELSETIFSKDFYTFSFQRSYFSNEYSTSFPLGYPVLIALVSFVTQSGTHAMILINLLSLTGIFYIVNQLKNDFKIPTNYFLEAILISTVIFEEVLSGRSIVPCVFFFMLFVHYWRKDRRILAFLFLGITPLIRFDFLPIVLLALLYLNIKSSFNRIYNLIVFVGLSPWILYSLLLHDTFWATDNSWIPFSISRQSFVADFFPENETLFTDPLAWIKKVLINTKLFMQYKVFDELPRDMLAFSILTVLYIIELFRTKLSKGLLNHFVLASSFVPYLITGYYESRYFIIHAIVLALYFMFTKNNWFQKLSKYSYILLVVTFIQSTYNYSKFYLNFYSADEQRIEELFQNKKEGVNYVFRDARLGAKYAAKTKDKCFQIPSNFSRMTEKEKQRYYEFVSPYEMIQ